MRTKQRHNRARLELTTSIIRNTSIAYEWCDQIMCVESVYEHAHADGIIYYIIV